MKRKRNHKIIFVAIITSLLFMASTQTPLVKAVLNADFYWTPSNPQSIETIYFYDNSSGSIIAWYWDFGDGNTSVQKNPIHSYQDNGTYVVRLSVWNEENTLKTVTKDITILNTPPIANAGESRIVNNTLVEFNASFSSDPDGVITNYKWLFGDGNQSTGKLTTHTYGKDRVYTVRLNVTDNDGAWNEDTVSLTVDTESPTTTYNLTGNLGKNNWYKGNVSVTLNATDNLSGINTTIYYLFGNWFPYTNAFNVSEEGFNVIEYYSIDNATNNEEIKSVDVKIDNTPPVTECILTGTMGNRNWYLSTVTVSFNTTDNLSGIDTTRYKLDDGDWDSYDDGIDVTGNGQHIVYFYSVDNASNTEHKKNMTFKIDKEKPVVHIEKPEEGHIYIFGREIIPTLFGRTKIFGRMSSEATITDEFSGAYAVYFELDDEILWEDYIAPYQAELPQEFPRSRHTLTAKAYDKAGNSASASEEIDYIKIL